MALLSKKAEKKLRRFATVRVKATRGSEPAKLIDYLCSPGKQLQSGRDEFALSGSVQDFIFCRSIPGTTTLELARNFRLIAKLNPKVTKTIAHYSISLPLDDNQKVNSIEMHQISRALLKRLGHARCPYFGVEHHDTKHRHWHLATSTVSYSGEWVSDSFDRYRLRQIEKELELRFGLKQTQTKPVAAIKNLSTGEYRLRRRTEQLLPKERLWAALDECIPLSSSLTRLVIELRVRHPDISIQLREKVGAHVGISFAVDGIAFSGGKLGRAYSLNGLRRYHGIQHEAASKALLDEILALPTAECRSLYQTMQQRSHIEQPDPLTTKATYREICKPQLEF